MVPPDQSISLVIELKMPSSVVIGRAKRAVRTATFQPEPASGFTTTMGWSRGNCTRNRVTLAVDDSFGTLNVSTASLVPWGIDEGLTVTCAAAESAPSANMIATSTATAPNLLLIPLLLSSGGLTCYCTVSTKL